jgi:hypothetical protein
MVVTGRIGFVALITGIEGLRLNTIDGKGWFQEGLL